MSAPIDDRTSLFAALSDVAAAHASLAVLASPAVALADLVADRGGVGHVADGMLEREREIVVDMLRTVAPCVGMHVSAAPNPNPVARPADMGVPNLIEGAA